MNGEKKMSGIICGVDQHGRVRPIGMHYDETTEIASLSVSRGAGKNTFSQEYTTAQTNTVIIAIAGGRRLHVAGVYICGDGAAGVVSLDLAASGIKVFRHYMTKYNQSSDLDMHMVGDIDDDLLLTTTTGTDKVFVIVNYWVEE